MKESHKKLLKQFSKIADDGLLGDQIAFSRLEYSKLPEGIPIMLKIVSDFLESSHESELSQMRHITCQVLIVAYREASRKNTKIAENFLNSFIQDYPDVAESCLLPRWVSLANACLALKEISKSGNRLLIWQQAIKQFQAYNEFLKYLAAISVIAIMEFGSDLAKSFLPDNYRNVFTRISL